MRWAIKNLLIEILSGKDATQCVYLEPSVPAYLEARVAKERPLLDILYNDRGSVNGAIGPI